MKKDETIERHTISVLVDNEAGVLARVIGLFSGRGYNIESLTVAEVDQAEHTSRITVVTSGTPMVIEQIKAQLDRLVPVHRVIDLTVEAKAVDEAAELKDLAEDISNVMGGLQNDVWDEDELEAELAELSTPAVRTKTLAERLVEVAVEEELTEAEVEAAMK